MRFRSIFQSSLLILAFGWSNPVPCQANQPALVPGKVFHLLFPELGPSEHSDQTRVGVYLPTDYSPDRKFPLLVWFGGGPGGDNPAAARQITGDSGFICAALPYRKGLVWKSPWSSYEPMLRELERVVPNIHPRQRACSGFSSGGAAICFSISEKDPGFLAYFKALMPGGAGWVMGQFPSLKDKAVYAYIGAKDTRVMGFDTIAPAAKSAGADVTYLKYDAGHEMPTKHLPEIRRWLVEKVVLADLAPLATAMRGAATRKEAGKAYGLAREVAAITPMDMAEHAEAKAIMERMLPLGRQMAGSVINAPLAMQQRFVLDWKGCDFAAPIEAKCRETAESQLKKILAQKPVSVDFLKKYINLWEGFPYKESAILHYDKLAVAALDDVRKLPSKAARNSALKKFITTWAPAPCILEARALREEFAREELDSIRAIPATGTMKSRLREFVREFEGTAAEKDARALLGG